MRAAVLAVLCAAPAAAQDAAPKYFVEGAALLRVASHIAANCDGVQVDIEADLDLRVAVYDLLERDGWKIDDPRLHSQAAREAVLGAADVWFARLGLSTPLSADEACPVARAQSAAGSPLGQLFRIDGP